MALVRTFNPVKLFTGLLVSDAGLIPAVRDRLAAEYGPIDLESPVIPFAFTSYYESEMGDALTRVFFSFERLVGAEQLPEVKRRTNLFEDEMKALLARVPRPVNLDPGYIENAKVVLATTKNFYHRIYLDRGIFAEVTMHFKHNSFQFFPWTYPDYQSPEYQTFFLNVRGIYRSQLRSMCILKREEQS
jgi:hypothetical protein